MILSCTIDAKENRNIVVTDSIKYCMRRNENILAKPDKNLEKGSLLTKRSRKVLETYA